MAVLAATADVRGAIGFSSFGVLVYYTIANASAFTLGPGEGRPPRLIPVVGGAIGCVVLAFALPLSSVISGAAVLGIGIAAYGGAPRHHPPNTTGRIWRFATTRSSTRVWLKGSGRKDHSWSITCSGSPD